MRRTTVGLTLATALLVGATGCGGSSSKAGGASPSTVAGTSAASVTSTTSLAPPTTAAAATTAPSGAGVHVDVVITGTHAVVIKGTKGQCDPATKAFVFKGSDYPDLGAAGMFGVSGAHGDQTAAPRSG